MKEIHTAANVLRFRPPGLIHFHCIAILCFSPSTTHCQSILSKMWIFSVKKKKKKTCNNQRNLISALLIWLVQTVIRLHYFLCSLCSAYALLFLCYTNILFLSLIFIPSSSALLGQTLQRQSASPPTRAFTSCYKPQINPSILDPTYHKKMFNLYRGFLCVEWTDTNWHADVRQNILWPSGHVKT